LNKAQIQDLLAYIRSFDPSPKNSPGDSADDFDQQFRELLEELEALQEEFRKANGSPPKP
jgi:hypothetical protein